MRGFLASFLVARAVLFFARALLHVSAECSYESDNMTAYRGCVNTGHNGEKCANWLSECFWEDAQFIRKEEAAKNGMSMCKFVDLSTEK